MAAPLQITCPECGGQFEVPGSMSGGVANCPDCRRAVPVPGGPEPLFWLAVAGGVLAVLLATGLAWLAGGVISGAVVFCIAALVFAAVLLGS